MTALHTRPPVQSRRQAGYRRPTTSGTEQMAGLRALMSLADPSLAAQLVVLIPAHNEAASIKETINSLRRQTHPPDEIIVVSDNSIDATDDRSMLHGAKVLVTVGERRPQSRRAQPGTAEDSARRCTDHDLVLVMDADSQLAPGLDRVCHRRIGT